MKTMFITVGTGKDRKDIASAIIKSIDSQNPDKVIFFVSEKTAEETVPEIRTALGREGHVRTQTA